KTPPCASRWPACRPSWTRRWPPEGARGRKRHGPRRGHTVAVAHFPDPSMTPDDPVTASPAPDSHPPVRVDPPPRESGMKPLSGSMMLRVLLLGVTVAFAWILLPFYGTVLWGAIIALLFTPLNRWLLPRMGQRRNLAALTTMLVALLIVVLPAVLIASSLTREAS